MKYLRFIRLTQFVTVALSAAACTACLTLTEEPFAQEVQEDLVVGIWVKQGATPEEGPAVLSIARADAGYIGWHGRGEAPQTPLIRLNLARLANGLWAQIDVPGGQCQKFVPFGAVSRCYLTARVSGLPDRLVLSHPRPAHWVRRSLAGDIATDHALVGAGGKGPTLWSFYLGSPMESVARVLGDDTLPDEAFEPLVEYARER